MNVKKTIFCNIEFYLSRAKHALDKTSTADGTHAFQKEFNTSRTTQHGSRFKNH